MRRVMGAPWDPSSLPGYLPCTFSRAVATQLLLWLKAMTADVYPRDSCIAPDIHSMDHEYKLLGKLLGHTPFKVYVYNERG